MAKLHWRKEANETGLARIGQRERGMNLSYGKYRNIGYAGALYRGFSRDVRGYYFLVRSDELNIALYNSGSGNPFPTIEEAMQACEIHVLKSLKK